jgi:hypothetical protein
MELKIESSDIFENDIDNLISNNLKFIRKNIALAMKSDANFPFSASDIVLAIDMLEQNLQQLEQINLTIEISPAELEFTRLNHIRNTITIIEDIIKSERKDPGYGDFYKDLSLILQATAETSSFLLGQLVQNEIQVLEKSHVILRKIDESYLIHLKSFVHHIQLELGHGQSSILKLCELREELVNIHNRFLESAKRDDLKDVKEESFFEKKIEPYFSALSKILQVVKAILIWNVVKLQVHKTASKQGSLPYVPSVLF